MKDQAVELLKPDARLSTVRGDRPDDLYLVGAGYEERAPAVTDRLAPGYRARKGVIYVNGESLSDGADGQSRRTLAYLHGRLAGHCDTVEVAEGSWQDAVKQLRVLKGALTMGEQANDVVTFDITSFTRESLLVATLLLREQRPGCTIRSASTIPLQYGTWLTRGFRGVRNVMGLSGLRRATRPTVLMVLSGFEPDRTTRIIEEHEPSAVLLGVGDGATHRTFTERNMGEQQQLMLDRQDVEGFRFSTTNIGACAETLEQKLAMYVDDHNIVIAPMSTKISTLAALVVAERHRDIQVTYCAPGEYNTVSYSTGIGDILVQRVPNLEER